MKAVICCLVVTGHRTPDVPPKVNNFSTLLFQIDSFRHEDGCDINIYNSYVLFQTVRLYQNGRWGLHLRLLPAQPDHVPAHVQEAGSGSGHGHTSPHKWRGRMLQLLPVPVHLGVWDLWKGDMWEAEIVESFQFTFILWEMNLWHSDNKTRMFVVRSKSNLIK